MRHQWVVRYQLTVVAAIKNEAPDILEWLSVHRMNGVDHFVLFDDDSTDGTPDLLLPWVRAGIVELHSAGGQTQVENYRAAIKRLRWKTAWVAFLDADEFLWSPEGASPVEFLKVCKSAALLVPWVLFGSSGHVVHPEGRGVLESYQECIGYVRATSAEGLLARERVVTEKIGDFVTGHPLQGKMVVNPRRIFRVSGLHQALPLIGPMKMEDGTNWDFGRTLHGGPRHLQVNHYWSKSIGQLATKVVGKQELRHRREQRACVEDYLSWEAELCGDTDATLYDAICRVA